MERAQTIGRAIRHISQFCLFGLRVRRTERAELRRREGHGRSAKKAAAKDSMVRSYFETWVKSYGFRHHAPIRGITPTTLASTACSWRKRSASVSTCT